MTFSSMAISSDLPDPLAPAIATKGLAASSWLAEARSATFRVSRR